MTNRKAIPQNIQDKVLTLSGRRCCLCWGINSDFGVKKGQIAHLDQNPENNAIDNLVWLCFDHHDEYDSKTSQSKGLTIGEVKRYRAKLYEDVERSRQVTLPASKTRSREKALYVVGGSLVLIALIVFISWYLRSSLQRDAACNKPIRTATATIEVIVASDEDVNTTYMDSGAYIAFSKGGESLLLMSSKQCTAKQTGNGEIVYRAVTNMDVSDSAFGKPVSSLEEAEYILISFLPMPQESRVLGGKATGVFNGETVLEMSILPQETQNGRIFIRDLRLTCGSK